MVSSKIQGLSVGKNGLWDKKCFTWPEIELRTFRVHSSDKRNSKLQINFIEIWMKITVVVFKNFIK